MPKVLKPANIGTAAGFNAAEDPMGVQKQLRQAFMAGPGAMGGRGGKIDQGKVVLQAMQNGAQTVGRLLTETFSTAAGQMKEVLTSTDVATSLGNAVKSAFDATTIDLNANLGPLTVNLTGGELLKTLSDQLLDKLRGDIAEVVSSIFNNDGSQKTITNTQIPRE